MNIKNLILEAKTKIEKSLNISELELIRVQFLGKNGYFSKKIKILRDLPLTEKVIEGKNINIAKKKVQQILIDRIKFLKSEYLNKKIIKETLDISLPGRRTEHGGLHPITLTMNRIEHFFGILGFSSVSGFEIEDNYHNFDALNIPLDHPARTTRSSFWFDKNRLLRTQTSSVQIRIMKKKSPPIRIISSGRVYRNDYDQTHTPMFHQTEGLFIDSTNANFSYLKSILCDFLRFFFEKNIKIRFRPSYFPFTEPSAEIDIIGKNLCWLEVLGCGLVHPKILRNVNIDPKKYTGFAFGIGIERLTMLRYDVQDLRIFFENDLRFLQQFKS